MLANVINARGKIELIHVQHKHAPDEMEARQGSMISIHTKTIFKEITLKCIVSLRMT